MSKLDKEKEVATAVRKWWDKKKTQRTIRQIFRSSSKFIYLVRNTTILVAKKLGFNSSRNGIFRKSREEDTSNRERICHDRFKRFEYLGECLEGPSSYRELERIIGISALRAPSESVFRGVSRVWFSRTIT